MNYRVEITTNHGSKDWVDKFMRVVNTISNPIGEKEMDDMAKIVTESSKEDLKNQVQPNGSGLRNLMPSTWAKKKSPFILIETGALLNSYHYEKSGKMERRVFIGGERNKIADYLDAGTSKMKAFNFFGFGKNAETKINSYLDKIELKDK